MKTKTQTKILDYIRKNHKARAHDLVNFLNISQVAVHKQLKKMIESDLLKKSGKPPLVFYQLITKAEVSKTTIKPSLRRLIDERYLYISPTGELVEGFTGFLRWLTETKQQASLLPLALEYTHQLKQLKQKYNALGLLDATDKYQTTFSDRLITKLYYLDFYALPKFGKTKLGQLLLHAKQSQNRQLITQITTESQPSIERLIEHYQIEAVAFIPPSIPRKLQFLKVFREALNIPLPHLELVKAYTGQVIVAQKSLSSLTERRQNARETIFLKTNKLAYQKILLLDDAVGSGSTMHEVAAKIKGLNPRAVIIGFAVVGSFKGFDIIKEV